MRLEDRPAEERQKWLRFGELLRDHRETAGLSRTGLAALAGLSDATIKFIETGMTIPSRATLIRLAGVSVLGLSWSEVPGNLPPPRITRLSRTAVVRVMDLEEAQGMTAARARAYLGEKGYQRVGRSDLSLYKVGERLIDVSESAANLQELVCQLAVLEGRNPQAVLGSMNPRWVPGSNRPVFLDALEVSQTWLFWWGVGLPQILSVQDVRRYAAGEDPFWVWPCDGQGNRVSWPGYNSRES